MAGNYEKSIYNQLMEVLARLDAVEKDLSVEKVEHKEDVDRLNLKIDGLTKENTLLRNDNERLKSIMVLCQEKVQVKSGIFIYSLAHLLV